jgi:hypothetical protein
MIYNKNTSNADKFPIFLHDYSTQDVSNATYVYHIEKLKKRRKENKRKKQMSSIYIN